MKLGERIGVSYQQIQKYENGTNNISVRRLRQMAKALDVPIQIFFPTSEMVSETLAAYEKMTDDEDTLLRLYRGIQDKKTKKSILDFLRTLSK